ncbi:MarR family winged helix-turn-helix transcriptional regulator [Actinocorallia aurea]
MKQISALLAQAFEPLYETAPVTPGEVDILITLRYAERPVIARRLAEHHGLSRAGISKTLAKLEKRGYIARTPNPADRRAALVTITPEGASAIDSFFPSQLAIETVLLRALGSDRPRVLDALTLLSDSLHHGLAELPDNPA